ncbi:hypothetical protein NQ036_06835 [Brevibacterium sp. 91QC2O2]|uniref:hypothetical protein n=1 Tax=Brevibacterium sp. 91QC2O2 TaxID=2968458 RepID=UPI00211D10E2|nr:hypothetical protein [Brevibacterium sp. 91QC2O2]MCQ9367959.1 hypothetical protein [Brevibacterium sp. 91QC2O2]
MTIDQVVALNRDNTTALVGSAYRHSLTAWNQVDPGAIAASWSDLLPAAASAVATAQYLAGTNTAALAYTALDAQDIDAAGPVPNPAAVAGFMPETGALVESALAGVGFHALDRIAGGQAPAQALAAGRFELGDLIQLATAGAGEAMGSVVTASRSQTIGWVRVAQPGCCIRCSLLAGRWYRWNRGFKRHPGCRCEHFPAREVPGGDLGSDPYQLFESLSESEQARIWTRAGAQAIREGGDIYQIGNSISRPLTDGTHRTGRERYTTEGTTRYGAYRRYTARGQAGKRRMTVGEIYRQAGDDRTLAVRMLWENGYIFDEGQIAGGVIRGQVEGFGKFGRGGTRAGAREAVLNARRTGTRDPRSMYTATAAELRELRAQQR